jgi:hypothetical protein
MPLQHVYRDELEAYDRRPFRVERILEDRVPRASELWMETLSKVLFRNVAWPVLIWPDDTQKMTSGPYRRFR